MSLYNMRIIKSLLLSMLVLGINCLLCLRGLRLWLKLGLAYSYPYLASLHVAAISAAASDSRADASIYESADVQMTVTSHTTNPLTTLFQSTAFHDFILLLLWFVTTTTTWRIYDLPHGGAVWCWCPKCRSVGRVLGKGNKPTFHKLRVCDH